MKSTAYFINFKKILSVLLIISIVFCSVSCKKAEDDGVKEDIDKTAEEKEDTEITESIKADELLLNLNAEVTTLNPLMIKNEELLTLMMAVFEPAIRLDSDGNFKPSVIESWNVDITGLIYTFTLYDEIYFHDKSLGKVTAEDLKNEMELLMTADYSESIFAEYVDCISYIEALSDTVLQVHTVKPTQDIMFFMTFPVLPMELYADGEYWIDSLSKPIGTGPFIFKELSIDGSLKLIRNEEYRNGVPEIKSIIAKPYKDEASALLDFQKQKINSALTSFINARTICTNDNTSIYSSLTNKFDCLIPTKSTKVKDDKLLRHIIASSIDRKALITNVLGGMGISSYTAIKPGLEATRSFDYEEINEDSVKSYFNGKGYLRTNGMYLDENGNEFIIKIAYYESEEVPYRSRIVSEITNQLKACGISVISTKLTKDDAISALLTDEYDFVLMSFNMKRNNDIDFLFNGNYIALADNTDLFEAVLKLKNSSGEEEYDGHLLDLYKKLLDEMPLIGLYYKTYLMFLNDSYSSVHVGNYLDMLSDINSWKVNNQ